VGARIEGVDVGTDIDEDLRPQLQQALWEHGVLVFSGADVGMEEQVRVVSCFGPVQPLEIFRFLGEPNPVLAIDPKGGGTVDQEGKARRKVVFNRRPEQVMEFQGWHTDSSFTSELPQAAALRAEVIPPVGGDTCFASLCAAHDALSPVMRDWLVNLRAIHAVPAGYKEAIEIWQYGDDAEARFDAEYPPREHPVVIEHPRSRRRALFVNPSYTVRIAGMTDRESAAILRFLYNHIATPDFVYRHHWSPGDIVVWDELVCLHLAPQDYHPHERKVVRVTAGSVAPVSPLRIPTGV
jgi:taurine dioxygenase